VIVVYLQMSNILAMSWREQVIFEDDDARFVLEQQA